MDKLESMRTFIRVVDAGGFSAAADSLDVAKSGVSQRVIDLEKHLGVRLLNRTTRNISLTDSGRVFYENSVRILADLDEVVSAITEDQATLTGSLRISAPMSFGLLHLVPAINDFITLHPELDLDLDLNDRHVNLVEEGFDLAIRIGDLEDSSLIARRLAPVHRLTCASPAYLIKHGTPQTPKDLLQHKGLIYSHTSRNLFWKYWIDGEDACSVDVPTHIRVNNGDALCEAAIAGLGITVLPAFIIHTAIEHGELVPLLTRYHCHKLSLFAMYPPPRYQPQRVRSFVEFLSMRYGDIPYWDNIMNY